MSCRGVSSKQTLSVHRMVMELEERGLIRRRPGAARSIEVTLPPEQLPVLR
jgi:SOS-response transcriptional repressor LexA